MALRALVLECDSNYCDNHADDFRTPEEATEEGWFILKGPERELGGNGERVYCSKSCMETDL